MNLSTFSKHFFSFRTRHLRWIDHSTQTTPSTGLKKKKKKTTNIIIIIREDDDSDDDEKRKRLFFAKRV